MLNFVCRAWKSDATNARMKTTVSDVYVCVAIMPQQRLRGSRAVAPAYISK